MQLSRQELRFDHLKFQTKATQNVTEAEVIQYFKETFFTAPKRINIKQYAPKHVSDKIKIDENKVALGK